MPHRPTEPEQVSTTRERERERILREPFWGAFRRRRPAVDVVLLPPEARTPSGDAEADPSYDEPAVVVAAAERAEILTAELWLACTGADECDPAGPPPRWTHGPRKGVVRREISRVLTQADPVTAALAVDRGATALRDEGWTVTEPTDGTPRVLASRGEGARREEALVLAAVDTGRVVVRYRSGGLVVPRAAARRLVAGGAA
ncbi:hypothetical protein [uncultured Nocardioides sp.]|uniref:hypothetical protein n=1 Tax=uncultured Nocardioides sp. TaxID=198441 RepID=UPI002630D907|nr:hypothetical protein [uncultured Nocardioides sp.]